jgi:hypothetical protein
MFVKEFDYLRNEKKRQMESLAQIISRFNQDNLTLSDSIDDGGTDPLWPRFERAATNQIENSGSTVSR